MKTVNNNMWLPNFIDNFFLENRLDTLNNYETFSNPAINIVENLSNFVVELAAPGLQKENFGIEVEEGTLIVASKIEKEEEVETESRYKRKEFNFSNFERSFKLPENIKVENILANYDNGVLKVTLPKMEEKKVLKRMVEIS